MSTILFWAYIYAPIGIALALIVLLTIILNKRDRS